MPSNVSVFIMMSNYYAVRGSSTIGIQYCHSGIGGRMVM